MQYTLSFLLIFLNAPSYAQVTIQNISITKPDTNILYHKVENRIKVSGTKEKINLISKNGSRITNYDSNLFAIIPNTWKPDTLMVFAGKKILLEKEYIVHNLPEITIQLGNIRDTAATVSEIIANKGLRVLFKESLYNSPAQVRSFSTTIVGADSDTLSFNLGTNGNLFSMEQETIIKKLKPNSKIHFDDILAVGTDSRTRRLHPFTITIK